MKLVSRFVQLVWGGDVIRALRPVLAVSPRGLDRRLPAYPFMGIWAIKHLGAAQVTLAFALPRRRRARRATGYVGGHLSDRIGRRPLILFGWGFQALVPLLLLAVGTPRVLGLALLALLPAFGSLGGAADQAMVADLVAPERREAAYASVRVASNLGVDARAADRRALLLVGGLVAPLPRHARPVGVGVRHRLRYIPRGGTYAPEGPARARLVRRDHPRPPFLLFMVSSVFATMTYVATETLLPISLVDVARISRRPRGASSWSSTRCS